MKNHMLITKLLVLAVTFTVGAILTLGAASEASPIFLSPLATPHVQSLHLPLMARDYQGPPPDFLRAPYYGTWALSCVFDHDLPGSGHDDLVTHYNGITSTENIVCYDGHIGYDYFSTSRYDPVLAAADGTISAARWNDPANHRFGLGLYVRMQHDHGYTTDYGHLSAIVVDVGTVITNATDGRIIGISGNTGNVSDGCDPNTDPRCAGHLHLTLKHNGFSVIRMAGQATTPILGSNISKIKAAPM